MPDLGIAALSGVLAAQVMELPAYMQRALGLPIRQDIFAETGAILRVSGRLQRFAGWFGHAVTAGVVAMAYAVFFDAVGAHPPSLACGLAAGLVHFAVGGVVIAAYPAVHPDVPVRLPVPGFSYRRWGWRDIATFLAGHLVFATLVTLLYRQLV